MSKAKGADTDPLAVREANMQWQDWKGGIGTPVLDVVCQTKAICALLKFCPVTQGNTKYVRLQDLNAGAFGFVVLARDTETDEAVAIKFMKRNAVNKVSMSPVHCASVCEHHHSAPEPLTCWVCIGSTWRGKSSTTPSCCT